MEYLFLKNAGVKLYSSNYELLSFPLSVDQVKSCLSLSLQTPSEILAPSHILCVFLISLFVYDSYLLKEKSSFIQVTTLMECVSSDSAPQGASIWVQVMWTQWTLPLWHPCELDCFKAHSFDMLSCLSTSSTVCVKELELTMQTRLTGQQAPSVCLTPHPRITSIPTMLTFSPHPRITSIPTMHTFFTWVWGLTLGPHVLEAGT